MIKVQGDRAFGRGIEAGGWSSGGGWSWSSKGAAVSGRLRNRRGRLVLGLATLTMALAWATAAVAAPGWSVVPSVDPSASENVLNAVAVRNSSDAWAVGQFLAPDQDDDGLNMLTEHWNGSSWTQVAAPAVLHRDESLLAVSASSASDAWAVGFTKTVSAAGRNPLAVHWNGSNWTIVATPTLTGGSKSTLNGVVALSPTNAWAVGRGRNGAALAEHWNGTAWATVQVPTPAGAASSQLSGISALSPSDMWAAGSVATVAGTTVQTRTLVEHWNGRAWSIVTSRNATNSNLLTGVAAVAANNVWAVGYTVTTDGTNQPDKTLIEHWNGSAWSLVASPSPASNDTLSGVAARSASDVWAVGARQDRSGPIPIDRTLTEHWNGSAWSVVASPNVGGNDNLLNGVGATSGDVWTVGSSEVTDHTLILRETG